jgi:hypothetical protein
VCLYVLVTTCSTRPFCKLNPKVAHAHTFKINARSGLQQIAITDAERCRCKFKRRRASGMHDNQFFFHLVGVAGAGKKCLAR